LTYIIIIIIIIINIIIIIIINIITVVTLYKREREKDKECIFQVKQTMRKTYCTTCVIASQYATSIVNRCWSGFPCKWRYINVETFNLYTQNTISLSAKNSNWVSLMAWRMV